jgi:hypothetical protein
MASALVSVRNPIWTDWRATRAWKRSGGPASQPWITACVLLVLPVAAIAHHLVFFPQTCMLNSFAARDYDLAGVSAWLSRDPSLYLATIVAVATFHLGQRFPSLRSLVLPFVIAFAPLALWIWDLPGTGRFVCAHLHDNRIFLIDGSPLRTLHLYLFGAALYPVCLAVSLQRQITDRLRQFLLLLSRSEATISEA